MNILSKKSFQNDIKNDYLFSTSLIFDENIDKLWIYMRDLSNESKSIDFIDNFKYIIGDNTWTPGNIFSLYWVGVSNIEIKCISTKVDRMRKEIKWECNCDIGINYYKILNLFRITQSNKTLVKIIFTRTEIKNNSIDSSSSLNYYNELQFKILKEHSRHLKNEEKELISYESCIVNQNYKKIWSRVIEFKNISALSPMPMKDIKVRGHIYEVGSFIKFVYEYENIKETVFLKVIKYEMSEQKKNWLIRYETIGTCTESIARIFEFKMTIINDNKVQLSYYHIFPSKTDKKMFDLFCIKKKEAIIKIKKFFEEIAEKDSIIKPQNNDD
jgi:hypothetical protein